MAQPPDQHAEKGIEIPEWDEAAPDPTTTAPKSSFKTSLNTTLDRILPPHRRYLGLARTTFLLVFLAALLALLALIIGLAVGLSGHSSSSSSPQNLPLPSNSETFSGELTYYQPGLGACGVTSTADDEIVSMSYLLFDAAGSSSSTGGNSNENPLCGRKLRATREGQSVDLTVVDRCTGCAVEDIDTSLGAFTQLAEQDLGRVEVMWAWL